jgi:hypothetical protein
METPDMLAARKDKAGRRATAPKTSSLMSMLKSAILDPVDPLSEAKYLTLNHIRAARDIAVQELGCDAKKTKDETLFGIAQILAINYQTTILKRGRKD